MLRSTLILVTFGIANVPMPAARAEVVRQAKIRWQPAPDSLPKGAQFALIAGDPVKPGPFAFRLRMPRGYVVRPHTHPAAENITVISGRLYHGMGREWRKAGGVPVAQGDFVHLPAAMPHSVWTTDSPAIIQVNGTGPFTLKYIRPQDDPRVNRRP